MSKRREPIHPPQWPKARRFRKHWAFWFYEETYRENIYVLWPVKGKDIAEFLVHQFGISESAAAQPEGFGGRTTELLADASRPYNKENSAQIISLASWDDDADELAVLSHEVFHAVTNIMSQRGVRFSNSCKAGNEQFAYLIERIFGTCLKGIRSAPVRRKPVR